MSAFVANLAVAIGLLVAGVGLLLAIVAFLAYGRLRSGRMLWIGAAFLGFTLEGVLLTVAAWQDRSGAFPTLGLLSLAILTALYLAVLKR